MMFQVYNHVLSVGLRAGYFDVSAGIGVDVSDDGSKRSRGLASDAVRRVIDMSTYYQSENAFSVS